MRRLDVVGLLTAAALVGAWELLVRSGAVELQYLPSPVAIAGGMRAAAASGDLAQDTLHTLGVAVLGWSAAAVLGVAGGVALGLSERAWRWSMASIEVIRAVPPITLVPLALLLFGFSRRMELIIVVFAGVWPVLINTVAGVRAVPVELHDVARTLRFSRRRTVARIVVPAAMPQVVVGLRLALSLALVLAIVAEMIGNPAGLGNALIRAQQALQPELMFAYVVVIGLLGVALNGAFRLLAARAGPAPGRHEEPM